MNQIMKFYYLPLLLNVISTVWILLFDYLLLLILWKFTKWLNFLPGVGGGYSLGHENRNTGGTVGRTRPILCTSQSNQQLSRSRPQNQQQNVVSKNFNYTLHFIFVEHPLIFSISKTELL